MRWRAASAWEIAPLSDLFVWGTPAAPLDKIQLYCEGSPEHFDWLVAQGYLAEQYVNFKRTNADPLLQTGAAAAQQGAAAGGKLLQAKRLAQHIICARIKQAHHRLGASAGREHHHGAAQLGRQAQGGTLIE